MNKYFLFFLAMLAPSNIYSMRKDCPNEMPKGAINDFSKQNDVKKLSLIIPRCPNIPLDENQSAYEVSEIIKSYASNIKCLDSRLLDCKKIYVGSYLKNASQVCIKIRSIIEELERTMDARKEEYYAAIKHLAKIKGIKDLNSCKELRWYKSKFVFLKYPVLIPELIKLKKLWLDYCGITEIPSTIGNLTNLEKLNLAHNELTEIPSTISNLTNLYELELQDNELTKVPSTIGNLIKLYGLYLNKNKIAEIPSTIGNLTNLYYLYLDNNKITEIPSTIGNLTNLYSLSLGCNKLTGIPSTIGNLTKLYWLALFDNKITEIPSTISDLTNLSELELQENELTEIHYIGNLTKLSWLCLMNNPINFKEIEEIKKLLPRRTEVRYTKIEKVLPKTDIRCATKTENQSRCTIL